MNNKVGLKDMFEHKEALTLMARSLNPNLPHVMQVRTEYTHHRVSKKIHITVT